MAIIRIIYKKTVITLDSVPGESLLDTIRRSGLPIHASCGGNGRCNLCRVLIKETSLSDKASTPLPGNAADTQALEETSGRTASKLTAGTSTVADISGLTAPPDAESVLACLTDTNRDLAVYLPEVEGFSGTVEEASDTRTGAAASADTCEDDLSDYTNIGAAADLGSTNVVVRLIDLESGRTLRQMSEPNALCPYGGDVITRIKYIMDHDCLDMMSGLVRNQISRMISGYNVKKISLAGNTIMQHIFAGISPVSISAYPFKPLSLFDGDITDTLDGIALTYAPCISGYVGGDITAGLLSSGVYKAEGISLFIDIGTNGEMAIKSPDGITSCSVASGPAFEGVNGIMGSEIIERIAALLDEGVIEESGYMEEDRYPITARDVRAIQLGKAAVAAGICTLLDACSVAPEDIDRIYIAGAFGSRLDMDAAIRIGMLPEAARGKIVLCGNSSLEGAIMSLLDPSCEDTELEISGTCRYIELSEDGGFNDRFVDNMTFDTEEYTWK